MEGPSCGPHCHAVAGAGAQVPEDVTRAIPTQHHAPNTTAGGCVIDVHHVAFCSSPRCCPGGLQRGGRRAAQGEVGRGQGIWKATDSQPLRATAHCSVLFCPVIPCALAMLDSSPQLPVGSGHAGHQRSSQREAWGQMGRQCIWLGAQYPQGLQLDMAGETPRAFEVGRGGSALCWERSEDNEQKSRTTM